MLDQLYLRLTIDNKSIGAKTKLDALGCDLKTKKYIITEKIEELRKELLRLL